MNGISPLWQHAQAYRNPQVRTRPKTRRPWKCRQRLRYRQHPRNHRRHRSRHKIQVIRNVRRPSILSLRALNPRMGRRAQLPIPVTTKARVKSFPRRIRCRIFVSSRSPIPRRKPNNVSLSPSCRNRTAFEPCHGSRLADTAAQLEYAGIPLDHSLQLQCAE